jgi:PhzF family phenazine biosynthesis protein
MLRLPFHQIDAFAEKPFEGNPAAVMPLDEWLPDHMMQLIAMENHLSETAFFVPVNVGAKEYKIRWFTPTNEVDLCGHATLASAWLVFNEIHPDWQTVNFHSMSGTLKVDKDGDWIILDFPRRQGVHSPEHTNALSKALGAKPIESLLSRDLVAVYETEEEVRDIEPDFLTVASLPGLGVLVTAKGNHVDFVCRCFFPQEGLPEDPATGSALSTLIPYWSKRLNKMQLEARQISPRGGNFRCQDCGDRVRIAGKAAKVIEGVMSFPSKKS